MYIDTITEKHISDSVSVTSYFKMECDEICSVAVSVMENTCSKFQTDRLTVFLCKVTLHW